MLWSAPWWGVWRWPGQRSAEVSSAPWAPGWARWSAAGWAWRWAALRNGSTRTCPWRRGSWVSGCPEYKTSQSDLALDQRAGVTYSPWFSDQPQWLLRTAVAESVSPVGAIHRKGGQNHEFGSKSPEQFPAHSSDTCSSDVIGARQPDTLS